MKARVLTILALGVALTAAMGVPAGATDAEPTYRFADGSQVDGGSILRRHDDRVSFLLKATELPAGHTVTVWYVIFNEPANCTHPEDVDGSGPIEPFRCGAGDLPPFGGDDSAATSVLWADGNIIGGSGKATFSGTLRPGDDESLLWGPGLTDPTGADIHLVVRDHGPLKGEARKQGRRDFGTCAGECIDLQFSVQESI